MAMLILLMPDFAFQRKSIADADVAVFCYVHADILIVVILPCFSCQRNPSQTPMYTHLNNHSKCGHLRGRSQATVSAGKVEIVRMSSLMVRVTNEGLGIQGSTHDCGMFSCLS